MSWDILPKENLEYFLEKLKGKIPTKTSDLTNDSEFITEEDTEVVSVLDTTPYLYRKSPAIGTRVMENALVGASVVVNQLISHGNFDATTDWVGDGGTLSVSNNVGTMTFSAATGKVKHLVNAVSNHVYLTFATLKATDTNSVPLLVSYIGSSGIFKYVRTNVTTFQTVYILEKQSTVFSDPQIQIRNARNPLPSDTTVQAKNVYTIDLTQWFANDPSIAENAYTKETAQAGSGIQWLKDNGFDFSKYIPHNTGTIESVDVTGKEVVGFNLFDGTHTTGKAIAANSGAIENSGGTLCISDYISVIGGVDYYLSSHQLGSGGYGLAWYDANKNYISGIVSSMGSSNVQGIITSPFNAKYIIFTYNSNFDDETNICLNLSKPTGTPKNGDYVPYEKYTYPITETTLRGLYKLVGDEIKANGDRLESDGTHEVRYGIVDLGTLTYTYNNSLFYADMPSDSKSNIAGGIQALCEIYTSYKGSSAQMPDKTIVVNNLTYGGTKTVFIKDTSYTDATTFKTAMNGVYLIYELATPTTEQLAPYTNPQISIVGGTEQFITNTDVPVGHESEYKDLPALFDDDYIQAVQERAENAIQNGWHDSVENLTDTDIDEPSDGQVMQFDASSGKWGNETLVIPSKTSDLVNDDGFITEEVVDVKTVFDSKPYLYRQTPLIADAIYDELVGASVVRNQLVTRARQTGTLNGLTVTNISNFTTSLNGTTTVDTRGKLSDNNDISFIAGHKYLVNWGCLFPSSFRIYLGDGNDYVTADNRKAGIINCTANITGSLNLYMIGNVAVNVTYTLFLCDITQFFGSSTIPDYAYTKETAQAGSGIVWLKSQGFDFSKYISNNPGTIESVEVTGKEVVGFNLFDVETDVINNAYINDANGNAESSTGYKCTKPIDVIGGETYYIKSEQSGGRWGAWYDEANRYISGISGASYYGNPILAPQNAKYIRFTIQTASGTNVGNPDTVCFNLSKTTGTPKNGDYVPYEKHTYPITETTLRGLFELVGDDIVANGDRLESDGTHSVKYGVVDAWTLNWAYDSTQEYFNVNYSDWSGRDATIIASKYPYCGTAQTPDMGSKATNTMWNWGKYIKIKDTSYSDATAFKTMLKNENVKIIYELATPTTEQLAPFTSPAEMNNIYTEEWITKNDVPVGHESTYKQLPEWTDDEYAQHVLFNKADKDITSYFEIKPYLYRRSVAIGDRVYDNKLIGASVVVNQLIDNDYKSNSHTFDSDYDNYFYDVYMPQSSKVSLMAGHKYLISAKITRTISGNDGITFGLATTGLTGFYVVLRNGDSNGFYSNIVTVQSDIETNTLRYNNYSFKRGFNSGDYISCDCFKVIDLTVWFGSSTIPDTAYAKEQAHAGIGIAWLKSQVFDFSNYISNNPGQLVSVMPTGKLNVGFNVWNEEWELGYLGLNGATNKIVYQTSTSRIRSKNFIKVIPGETYYYLGGGYGSYIIGTPKADENDAVLVISDAANAFSFTIPDGINYIKFAPRSDYGEVYKNNICINISDPIKNGTYEPYTEQSYDISANELRGILKLVGDEIVWDGDVREANGNTTRKRGRINLGAITPTMYTITEGNLFRFAITGAKQSTDGSAIPSLICEKYVTVSNANRVNKTLSQGNNIAAVDIIDNDYSSAASIQTALDGVYLEYELATPTTEQLTPFDSPQICYKDGTEEYIDNRDVPVPVGHESEYIKVPDWMVEEHVKDFRDRVYNVTQNTSVAPPTLHAYDSTTHKMGTNGITPSSWDVESMPSQMKDFYQKFETAINDHGTQLADVPADWTFIKNVTSTSGESVTIPNTASYIMVLLFGSYSPDPLLPATTAVCNSLETLYATISMSHYDVEIHGTYHNVDHYAKYDDESHKWSVSDANTSASIFYR